MAKLLKFFIYSNLLISCCALAFVDTGVQLLEMEPISLKAQVLVFSATFVIYNLNIFLVHLILKKDTSTGGKMDWFQRNQKLMTILIAINLLGMGWAIPYHDWQEILFFFQLGIISILYNVPDRYARSKFRSIRTVPFIKIFLIAYVWASIGAVYPALLAQEQHPQAFTLFGLFFIFIVGITLPFDIRDYYRDKRVSLLTIPGVVGIGLTKLLAVSLLLVYGIGLFFFFEQYLLPAVMVPVTSIFILASSSKSPDWYFSGIIDSLILLQFFLLLYKG